MDEKINHPDKWDRRPNRRKDHDNPYRLFSVGADTPDAHFFVSFQDGLQKKHFIEIDKDLFDELNRFELEDLSHLNEVDNHYARTDFKEEYLSVKALEQIQSLESLVEIKIEAENLHKAILELPEKQKRRIILYYFNHFTHQQIAEMEGCSQPAIVKSIRTAIERLRKRLGGER